MARVIRCSECGKAYRTLEQLEELRENESLCLRCRALIEVDDWDEILDNWEDPEDDEDEDFDDMEMEIEVDQVSDEEGEDPLGLDEEEPLLEGITSLEDVDLEGEDDEDDDDR